jgi:hypothetical protein
MESAQTFFRAAVSQEAVPWPEKINVDGNSATHRGLRLPAGDGRSPPADRSQPARERVRMDGSVRYPRKISFGGSLYLLVRPEGGRYWHYHYRYGGKRKTLSLGTYPDVPVSSAQSRHRAARLLLAVGVDPSLRRLDLRRIGALGPKYSLMVTQILVS